MSEPTEQLKAFSQGVFGFSLFFWTWAFRNSLKMLNAGGGNWDYGVVSFGLVVISSSFMMGRASGSGSASDSFSSLLTQWALPASSVVVAMNYTLGLILMIHKTGFAVYCAIFTGLWIVIAYFAYGLIKQASGEGTTGMMRLLS